VRFNRIIFLSLYIFCFKINGWQPRISIITSVFKGDYFIAPFLADITSQKVFDQCELILINANSPGVGCESNIIQVYCKKYPEQIVYLELDQDIGLYAVWNLAIRMARGEYLTNANLDDRLSPDCYEVHARVLDCNSQVDLVYSDSYLTYVPNENFRINSSSSIIRYPEFESSLMQKINLPSFNPMWRKALHSKYGYFDEQLKIAGDWDFWLRLVVDGVLFKKAPGIHGLFYYNKQGLSLNRDQYKRQLLERNLIRSRYNSFFKSNLK
jgi:hypothetical protein